MAGGRSVAAETVCQEVDSASGDDPRSAAVAAGQLMVEGKAGWKRCAPVGMATAAAAGSKTVISGLVDGARTTGVALWRSAIYHLTSRSGTGFAVLTEIESWPETAVGERCPVQAGVVPVPGMRWDRPGPSLWLGH